LDFNSSAVGQSAGRPDWKRYREALTLSSAHPAAALRSMISRTSPTIMRTTPRAIGTYPNTFPALPLLPLVRLPRSASPKRRDAPIPRTMKPRSTRARPLKPRGLPGRGDDEDDGDSGENTDNGDDAFVVASSSYLMLKLVHRRTGPLPGPRPHHASVTRGNISFLT
jgi:hypothetical protein